MATLVLTAVGTALAGPIGGAVGALLGQQIDAAIFAPKARQGARLTDLRVQTSSYGDAIPKIFGTLRVAGTVIWATDLIERRQKRSGGKGRPSAVEYSYSASLAVALSARPIRSIGRIWADGQLLRDSAGKLAEAVVLRVHGGSADQPVDPLIASALGPDQASAFRGIAYAMLEELDLTAFGNRIPQLSFEVIADDGLVSVAAITGELTGGAVAVAAGAALGGYAASGARVREALAPLADLAQLGLRQGPEGWQIAAPGAPSEIVDPALAQPHQAVLLRRESEQRTALAKVAESVSLRHYDPQRDYQTSVQTAVVAGGGARPTTLELPGALEAGAARSEAQRLALAAGGSRRSVAVRAGLGALALPLGAVLPIALADNAAQHWRIAERTVDDGGVRLTLIDHDSDGAPPLMPGDGGAGQVTGDLPGGATMLAIFDVPGDGEVERSVPLRLVAAAGSDARWRGADLWWIGEAGTEPEGIGRISGALALGHLVTPVPAMAGVLIDGSVAIEVALANDAMTLGNVSMAQLLAGANRAMLGGEALQFQRAEPLGEARWRLTGLLRGRAGTEDAAGPHGVGTAFALLDDAALLVLPDAMAARAVEAGAVIERQERGSLALFPHLVAAGGRAVLPLAPVHGRIAPTPSGGRLVHWIARSRAGARWRDGVDAAPGERQSLWRVQYPDADGAPVAREVNVPSIDIAAGAFGPGGMLSIVQVGDYGVSPPLVMPID
ncbi:MAG: hypothetical protein H2056_06605 [Sphingopyxis sp.]|nr:hypothetical protein [Sphingopyxis sp.]